MSLRERAIEKFRSEGVVALGSAGVSFLVRKAKRRTIDRVLFRLWRFGFLDLNDIYPENYYRQMTREAAREDARRFSELIIDRYEPDSVIDLGCGVGRFLEPFYERGIEIRGVDGAQAAVSNALVPADRLAIHDLTEPYRPDEQADIVFCLEVLEHLPRDASRTAAESIAASAPVAIITTAPPGQGGRHHVNEQLMEFWIEEFDAVGMRYNSEETEYLSNRIDADELRWLKTNLGVFERDD